MILGISFVRLSNVNILFPKQKLIWRSYILAKAISSVKEVQMIGSKKFVAAALDLRKKAIVLYIAHLGAIMLIDSAWQA